MKKHVFILCLGVVSGCADMKYVINDKKVSLNDIVDHVQCEVFTAWNKYNEVTTKEEWIAAVSLTMQESTLNSLGPTFNVGEFNSSHYPKFSAAGGLGFSNTNAETSTYNFAINIRSINPGVCGYDGKSDVVGGDIGIDKVVDQALQALKFGRYSQSLAFTEQKTFGKSITFTMVRSVNALGPTVALKKFTGPGGFLGVSRTNMNIVDISFGKKAPKEDIKAAVKRTMDNNTTFQLQRILAPNYLSK